MVASLEQRQAKLENFPWFRGKLEKRVHGCIVELEDMSDRFKKRLNAIDGKGSELLVEKVDDADEKKEESQEEQKKEEV